MGIARIDGTPSEKKANFKKESALKLGAQVKYFHHKGTNRWAKLIAKKVPQREIELMLLKNTIDLLNSRTNSC